MTLQITIDWAQALERVLTTGRTYERGVVAEPLLCELLEIELDWTDLDEQLPSGVYQQYAFASLDPQTNALVRDL